MEHHDINTYTLPKDKQVIYINEPWLVDKALFVRWQIVGGGNC